MVTRLTRLLLLIQLAAAIGLGIAAWRLLSLSHAWHGMLLGLGSVLLVRLLINANNFLVAWRHRSATPEPHILHWRQALGMFVAEFKSSMLTSSWYMPFFSVSRKNFPGTKTLPVLLIHGYGCNSGYWHHLGRKLSTAEITHHAIDLEPVFGEIDDYIPAIHAAIETLRRESGQERILIVAHSMGGLVARAYLRTHGAAHVAKVIALGVPHHGTGLAEIGIGKNSGQMRRVDNHPNGWLLQLAAQENHAHYALFVNIFSHHDNIVSPQTSSCLPDARNLAVSGIGHVSLAFHPKTQAMVMEEILGTPA